MSEVSEQAEELRTRRYEADRLAEEYRKKSSEYGSAAVRLDRALAELPCDVVRTRSEMVMHLAWVHQRVVSWRYSSEEVQEVHRELVERLVEEVKLPDEQG